MSNPWTPGPWHAGHMCDDTHPCTCTGILAERGPLGGVANIVVDNGKPISAGGNDGPDIATAKANARLIAAAPEMAEVLQELADDLQAELQERYGVPPHPANVAKFGRDMEPVRKARAILARIRGGSNA